MTLQRSTRFFVAPISFGVLLGAAVWAQQSRWASAPSRPQAGQPECACPILEQALTDANSIRKGMRRSEVEKIFVEDGGLTFLPKSRYIYRKCHLLKIDVDYEMTSKDKTSADDTVTRVSKLYVELPLKD